MYKRYTTFSKILTDANGTKYASGLPFMDYQFTGGVDWVKIPLKNEGRMDIIAWISMNDPYLYTLILMLNDIFDSLSVEEGTELAIPVDIANYINQLVPFTYRD